jgi:hypothetical protein
MPCVKSYGAQRTLRRMILLLSALAVVLASMATCGCTFFLSGPEDDYRSELEGYGLFKRAIYDKEDGSFLGCIDYSKFWLAEINDRPFKVARIFGVFSMALTVLAFICCALVMLFTKRGKSCWWGIMRMSYFFAFLNQLFVYSVWATKICKEFNGEETQCLAGPNGVIGAFNVMVLLALIIFSCIVPEPCHPMFRLWYSQDPEQGPYDSDQTDENLTSIEEEQSSDDSDLGMTRTHPSETSKYVAKSRQFAKHEKHEKQSPSSASRKSKGSGVIASRSEKSRQITVATSKASTAKSKQSTDKPKQSSDKPTHSTDKPKQSTDKPKHPESRSHYSSASTRETSSLRTDAESSRSGASKRESNANSSLDANSSLEAGDIIEIVEEFGPTSVTGSFDGVNGSIRPLGADDTEIIKVRTEYGPEGKKQIKEVTHADGSRTVTTLIDPMGLDDDIECDTLPDDAE